MRTEQVICYTCRFCKIDCRGGSLYCSLRKKGGQCIKYDKWESWENVLDKVRTEIDNALSDGMIHKKTVLGIIDKYRAESEGNISKMGIVEEEENEKIEEYKEVTLEELLSLKDKASWSGDTEDDEYQIYHVLPDYEPIKIKKSIVLEYLEKKDKENKG